MDDLISVIIPVYNAEKYIERCVKSIQNQTYTHFELILVNDGSTDNSLNLCEILASNDDRIVVVNRDNGGASAARNTGLAHIRGNYVIFADSDDYVSPSYIENLYFAAKHYEDLGYEKVFVNNPIIQDTSYEVLLNTLIENAKTIIESLNLSEYDNVEI